MQSLPLYIHFSPVDLLLVAYNTQSAIAFNFKRQAMYNCNNTGNFCNTTKFCRRCVNLQIRIILTAGRGFVWFGIAYVRRRHITKRLNHIIFYFIIKFFHHQRTAFNSRITVLFLHLSQSSVYFFSFFFCQFPVQFSAENHAGYCSVFERKLNTSHCMHIVTAVPLKIDVKIGIIHTQK